MSHICVHISVLSSMLAESIQELCGLSTTFTFAKKPQPPKTTTGRPLTPPSSANASQGELGWWKAVRTAAQSSMRPWIALARKVSAHPMTTTKGHPKSRPNKNPMFAITGTTTAPALIAHASTSTNASSASRRSIVSLIAQNALEGVSSNPICCPYRPVLVIYRPQTISSFAGVEFISQVTESHSSHVYNDHTIQTAANILSAAGYYTH